MWTDLGIAAVVFAVVFGLSWAIIRRIFRIDASFFQWLIRGGKKARGLEDVQHDD